MTQADLVRLTGEKRTTISAYAQGDRMPGSPAAIRLSEALGVRPSWLILGWGDREETGRGDKGNLVPVHSEPGEVADHLSRRNLLVDDIMLRYLGLSSTAGLMVVVETTNANQHEIPMGAPVLINRMDQQLREAIFALQIGNSMRIRRIHRDGIDRITAHCLNPIYPPEIYQGDDLKKVVVLGRAITAMTLL